MKKKLISVSGFCLLLLLAGISFSKSNVRVAGSWKECIMARSGAAVVQEHSVPVSSVNGTSKTGISYVAQNAEYDLKLPEASAFLEEFTDLVYWEYNTAIEKDIAPYSTIFTIFKEEGCLDQDVRVHAFYRESESEPMDEGWDSNFYEIILTFPDKKKMTFLSLKYGSRGLSLEYDQGYDSFFPDSLEDISSAKLEQKKWFQKRYTAFGESALHISSEEAADYKVTDHFAKNEKDKIIKKIKKAIRKYYKKEKDTYIFVRDFLPEDDHLQGEVVNLHITKDDLMPLYWIKSRMVYSKKRNKMKKLLWETHYSTGYSGASQPNYHPTVKQVKKWAGQEKKAVSVQKCVLAYHIRNGKLIDMKGEHS